MNTVSGRHPTVATAVLHLQSGRRDHATQLLATAHHEDPTDYRVTHALALMTLWKLVNRRGQSRWGAPDDWFLCLGLWASLLADPKFWTWFVDDAAHRYRTDVSSAQAATARGRLEQWLSETVARYGGDGMATLLTLEVRAAKVVAVRGGLAVGEGRRPIQCGPLLIQHLGLQQACRRLTAELWASRDEQSQRCAMYFSQLGPARMLLDAGALKAALASLVSLQCASCQRQDLDTTGAAATLPRLCRNGCASFDKQNPAYVHRQDDRRLFLADVIALTIEAHLGIAAAAILSADLDLPTAQKHWQEAVYLARTYATFGQIQQYVDDLVLKRVRFLRRSRTDDAIALLEAHSLIPVPSADDELFGKTVRTLGELLAQRGVDFANLEPSDLDHAAADLRRAAQFNPVSWYACRNLVIVLQNLAGLAVTRLHATAADLDRAATVLREALEKLEEFSSAAPGDEIDDLLDTTSTALAGVLNSQAVQAHERGAHDEALRIIDRALELMPGDQQLLQNRHVIVEMGNTKPVLDAIERRDFATALRLLDDGMRRNPRDKIMRQLRNSVCAQYADDLNTRAVRAHERGARSEALQLIGQALALEPRNAVMRKNKNVILSAPTWGQFPSDPEMARLMSEIIRAESGSTTYPEYVGRTTYRSPEPRRGRFKRWSSRVWLALSNLRELMHWWTWL